MFEDENTDVSIPVFVVDEPPIARSRTISRDHIMQFFSYSELGARQRELAKPYHELAEKIHREVASNPERAECLRTLLNSRDACLRAAKALEPL